MSRPMPTILLLAACAATAWAVSACDGVDGEPATTAAPVTQTAPEPMVVAIDTMGFTRQKPLGVAPGFDLDGRISPPAEVETCGKGDLVSPEGVPGIDNHFARLVPLVEASGIGALEGLIQSTINGGGIMLLLQLDGVDDPVQDATVVLRVREGKGVPLLGTNGLLLAGQTFGVHGDSPEVAAAARIVDGRVLAGPFDLKLPLVVFGVRYDLDLRGVHVRARLAADGGLVEGVLGAGVTMASIVEIAKKGAVDQPNLIELVGNVVGGQGDLARDAASGECAQMSATLAFTGVGAYLFDDKTARKR